MQIQMTPTGRNLPPQDWEGDDNTGGHYYYCTESSAGTASNYSRGIYLATQVGYVDGMKLRQEGVAHDGQLPIGGVSLNMAQTELEQTNGQILVVPNGWTWTGDILPWLTAWKGLCITGWYANIPAEYRKQVSCSFGHAMFAVGITNGKVLVYDPLDKDLTSHGIWIPVDIIRHFLDDGEMHPGGQFTNYVAYVDLQEVSGMAEFVVSQVFEGNATAMCLVLPRAGVAYYSRDNVEGKVGNFGAAYTLHLVGGVSGKSDWLGIWADHNVKTTKPQTIMYFVRASECKFPDDKIHTRAATKGEMDAAVTAMIAACKKAGGYK